MLSLNSGHQRKKVPYLFYSVKRADGTNYRILLDQLQLQVTNTLAFYSYLSLFSKSVVHLAFVIFCLCRRAAVHRDSQSSWWCNRRQEGHVVCILFLPSMSYEGLAGCARCFELLKVTYEEFSILTIQMFSTERELINFTTNSSPWEHPAILTHLLSVPSALPHPTAQSITGPM